MKAQKKQKEQKAKKEKNQLRELRGIGLKGPPTQTTQKKLATDHS